MYLAEEQFILHREPFSPFIHSSLNIESAKALNLGFIEDKSSNLRFRMLLRKSCHAPKVMST